MNSRNWWYELSKFYQKFKNYLQYVLNSMEKRLHIRNHQSKDGGEGNGMETLAQETRELNLLNKEIHSLDKDSQKVP